MKKIAYLILLIIVLSGCSEKPQLIVPTTPPATPDPQLIVPTTPPATPDPCSAEKINQFLELSESAEYRFALLTQQANSTPGEELEPLIKEMQAIETEAKEIDPPLCALKAKSALTSYFGTMIQGYFRLHAQGIGITSQVMDTRSADDDFNLAASKLEYYETEIEALSNTARINKFRIKVIELI